MLNSLRALFGMKPRRTVWREPQDALWWAWYRSYLASPEWKDKRKRVLKRDRYRCRDCKGKATQVHHLTYDRVGNERLSDLHAICKPCHEATHGRRL